MLLLEFLIITKYVSKLLQLIMKMLLDMNPIYCQNLTTQICHTFLALLLEKSFSYHGLNDESVTLHKQKHLGVKKAGPISVR